MLKGLALTAFGFWSAVSLLIALLLFSLIIVLGSRNSGPILVVYGTGDGGPHPGNWNSNLAKIATNDPATTIFLWCGDVRLDGTASEWELFKQNYGALVNKTIPTPGNHDWTNRSAQGGYNSVFAGDPHADVNSYCKAETTDGWTFVQISTYSKSSACMKVLTDAMALPGTQKIVVTHEPRWSGGEHGSNPGQDDIWNPMIGHAFALVSGHDHDSQQLEQDGLVQIISACAGAKYYDATPVSSTVYYSKSVSDCTIARLTLSKGQAKTEWINGAGKVVFTKTYTTTPPS